MSVETAIHTIRHGHTSYNSAKRYAGTIDVPLNEKGIHDALVASSKLAEVKFDVVVTSTLKRAIETARLIVGDETNIVQSSLCNERNFGVMEGHTWDEVQKFIPPILFIEVGNDLHSVNPAMGEPFEDVWDRAKRFRRFLFRNFVGFNILVVSHGVFLQLFHGVIRNKSCIESLANNYPSNLELNSFIFSGRRLEQERVVMLADKGTLSF